MKELEDLAYFPKWLRNFQTEFIGFVVVQFNIYKSFINHVNSLALKQQPMHDICSGSGQPAISIFEQSNCFSQLILTDKFPNNITVSNHKISYLPTSIDALEMEWETNRCYTMFNSFHHFKDEDKQKIIARIIAAGSRCFIIEILEPSIICFFKILITTTLGNILFTPFVKPFSFKRLFFTYIIPINIITITYDGIVSVCKSKSVNDYKKLFNSYGDSINTIKIGGNLNSLILIEVQPN